MAKRPPEDLYIYPGSQSYQCKECRVECIPHTFIQGHPFCLNCVRALDLNPQPLELGDRAKVGRFVK
jgi:hypothetical protein